MVCFHLAAVVLALQQLVAGAPLADGSEMCGTVAPDADYLAAAKEFADSAPHQKAKRQFARIVTPVYVHIVASSYAPEDGYVSDQVVNAQFTRINDDFRPHKIQFVVKNITRTINSNWANGGNDDAMKRALRRGNYDTLNFYIQRQVFLGGSSVAGVGYFPTNLTNDPSAFQRDATQVAVPYLPGGSGAPFDQGGVGTHEVGHWFGLFHTFEGNDCNGYGDYVYDTNAMINPPYYCDDTRDSCPAQPGIDPWNNHMNYVPDACKEIFTQGQEDLMYSLYSRYRGYGTGG